MRLKESNILLARLMLSRGLPGTGKTWAIRALMREWFDWCTFHYVVDPAVFFSNSTYMLSLLSKVGEVAEAEYGDDRKWSLVILEDVGGVYRDGFPPPVWTGVSQASQPQRRAIGPRTEIVVPDYD